MKSKKRPLPRRPPGYSNVLMLQAEAKRQGVIEAFILFFSVLRDKEGFGPKRLRHVLDTLNEYADSIQNGYITIQDLQTALKEEAGIELTSSGTGPGGGANE